MNTPQHIAVPLLLINCKNYGLTGSLAEQVAQAAAKVDQDRQTQGKKKVTIALAVPATDIHFVAKLGLVPVFAEHLDPETQGATTGKIVAENVLANGAVGTLINHSEDQYPWPRLEATVVRARGAGIVSVVCAPDAASSQRAARLSPDFVAMEPPELIGGDISVSTANPGLISETVEAVRKVGTVPVLVGAGVKNAADVRKGVELGAQGILVASGVTKAADMVAAIADLASGFD
jgi:triosephosphate isomerase